MSFLTIPYPHIDPVALALGPLHVKWYGLSYVAGLVLGWAYIRHLLATPRLWAGDRPPMPVAAVDDLLVWVAAGVLIGGRMGQVLFYEPSYYFSHPSQILAVWNGGMSFHGGALGTTIALIAFAWRNGFSVFSVGDLVGAAVPIGLFFGRIANFVNGEIVGTPTSMPWGMVFPGWGDAPRHPAMLYEAALEGVVLFLILRRLTHERLSLKVPGLTAGWFLIGYGIFRIVCELFKLEQYRLFTPGLPFSKGMAYSLPMLALGAWLVMRNAARGTAARAAGE